MAAETLCPHCGSERLLKLSKHGNKILLKSCGAAPCIAALRAAGTRKPRKARVKYTPRNWFDRLLKAKGAVGC